MGSESCTVHVNLHNGGLIIEAWSGARGPGPGARSTHGLMNDNKCTDRLAAMSYCAEFDMGSRIQAIEADMQW